MQPLQLTYSLSEDDFLQHQLFLASKSERIKRKRRKSWILASAAVLVLSFVSYQNNSMSLTYAFAAFTIYTILFYPRYLSSHYKNHYRKYIAETYKGRVNIQTSFKMDDDNTQLVDKTGESKLNCAELDSIVETGGYFYLLFKVGDCLIIPKAATANSHQVKEQLTGFCSEFSIPYTEELNWKWS